MSSEPEFVTRRSVSMRGGLPDKHTPNALKQRTAVKAMTEAQKICGMTAEELSAEQAKLRADARMRLGKH